MRGHPLRSWVIFCVCWAGLLWPVLRVSSRPAGTTQQELSRQSQSTATESVWINWRFTEPPLSATLAIDGTEICSVKNPGQYRIEELVEIDRLPASFEMTMTVQWETAGHRAVKLELEPIDASPALMRRFSEGELLQESEIFKR